MVNFERTNKGHEYRCNSQAGDCAYETNCLKNGRVPFDSEFYQPVPASHPLAKQAIKIRKIVNGLSIL